MNSILQHLQQVLRGIAFTAALVTPTVGVTTPTANAMEKNPCQDYHLKQASVHADLATAFSDLGQMWLDLGYTDLALDAFDMAIVHGNFSSSYSTLYTDECM